MSATTVSDPLEAFTEHQDWLRTALYARLGNREEVDEVMQEVAVAAASQSAKAVPVQRVGPWLYRVAIRQVMQFRRKAGRRRKLVNGIAERTQVSECDGGRGDPMDFLLNEERRQAVRRALAGMCEKDRQLLLLKYVEGLSYGEIARRIGVSASAVQSRLHRARGSMRKRLERLN